MHSTKKLASYTYILAKAQPVKQSWLANETDYAFFSSLATFLQATLKWLFIIFLY